MPSASLTSPIVRSAPSSFPSSNSVIKSQPCGPLPLGDPFLEQLARTNVHHPARRDRHFDPGLGITADPFVLVAQHKAAEAGDLDVLALASASLILSRIASTISSDSARLKPILRLMVSARFGPGQSAY